MTDAVGHETEFLRPFVTPNTSSAVYGGEEVRHSTFNMRDNILRQIRHEAFQWPFDVIKVRDKFCFRASK